MELLELKRYLAVAKFMSLEDDSDEIECTDEERHEFDGGQECGPRTYLVLTDEEADKAARDYIEETIWAFKPEFLVHYMPKGMTEDAIKLMQEKCEDANGPLCDLINGVKTHPMESDNMTQFVEAAIAADGRGNFLSTWDGNEDEIEVEGQTFYFYKN